MELVVKRFYSFILFLLFFVLLAEVPLEYRHHLMGYETPIVGPIITVFTQSPPLKSSVTTLGSSDKTSPIWGPTETFPFKSKVIQKDQPENLRLWIASASHAEGGHYLAKDIFPNQICGYVSDGSCEVINGSRAGMRIDESNALLKEYGPLYKPDYAILYQLSMDMIRQQVALTVSGEGGHSGKPSGLWLRVVQYLQSFSLYQHLTDYIGGNIKLRSQLYDKLPDKMKDDFEAKVYEFINLCRSYDIEPVLTTFAASHNVDNIDRMHFSLKTNFVRSATYLSPEGWAREVEYYNEVYKDIANKEGVLLIDIAAEIHGETSFFDDFIHFNAVGHSRVAKIIGESMGEYIAAKEAGHVF